MKIYKVMYYHRSCCSTEKCVKTVAFTTKESAVKFANDVFDKKILPRYQNRLKDKDADVFVQDGTIKLRKDMDVGYFKFIDIDDSYTVDVLDADIQENLDNEEWLLNDFD